jgi:hypothetical protein
MEVYTINEMSEHDIKNMLKSDKRLLNLPCVFINSFDLCPNYLEGNISDCIYFCKDEITCLDSEELKMKGIV